LGANRTNRSPALNPGREAERKVTSTEILSAPVRGLFPEMFFESAVRKGMK
jgi:hypothetical protein